MRKNSGNRSMSAALQHRKMSGSFERSQAEKRHSNVVNGRNPVMDHRSQAAAVMSDLDGNQTMGLLPSLGVAVAVAGSMFVVSYAAVLSAMAEAA
ncbi:hypothetical protein PRNP1_008848 [Phytophthora ramorum]